MLHLYTKLVKTCFHSCGYLHFIINLEAVKQHSQMESANINTNGLLLPTAFKIGQFLHETHSYTLGRFVAARYI